MKKLMIVAAAVAMSFAGEAAGIKAVPQICENCGAGGNSDCPAVVFKVTGSGKAVVSKGDYKEVKSLKIKKGALALVNSCADAGFCCYDDGAFFAKIKAGKASFQLAARIEPGVWSVFGKNLDKIRSGEYKAGKTYKLDSALFIRTVEAFEGSDNDEIYVDGDTALDPATLQFAASAFGKMNVKISKKKSGYCGSSECDPTYTPKSYSGYWVAKYNCVGEEDCFLCQCTDTDVAGGTWKATFKSSAKTVRAARGVAGVSVGSDLVAELDGSEAEEDEEDDE